MMGCRQIQIGPKPTIFQGTERTQVFGLVGHPLSHTLSPRMQQAAFDALGLDAVYLAFDVPPEALGEAWLQLLAAAEQEVLGGLNVTLPHKRSLLARVHGVDAVARQVGAVNVLRFGRPGGAVFVEGCNTDVEGLLRALEEQGVSMQGMPVVIVGTGGMAHAAVVAARQAGAAEIRVLARAPERAAAMLQDVASTWLDPLPGMRWGSLGGDPRWALADAAVLVQATSLGLHRRDPSPLSLQHASQAMFVFETIYQPSETALLREARAAGLAGVNGLGMLLHQGSAALRLWTGSEAPLAVMRQSLDLA